MAVLECILHLIVLNGFVFHGLFLLSSATTLKSLPSAQHHHESNQQHTEFPSKLDIVGLGQHSGKTETGRLELDGEMRDGYRGLNLKEVSSDDGETRRTEIEKEKRKWGENSMRVWGKRIESDEESRNVGENSVWDERAPTATDKRKWGDNSMSVWGKRSEDGNEKRKWGDSSMSVWGKRSDNDRKLSGHTDTSETIGEAEKHRGVSEEMPSWVKQEKVDLAKDTVNSQVHRILRKRSLQDHEEIDRPRYDWIVEEISKRNRGRSNSHGRQYGGPKRNWETNTMKVWGKRGLVWDTVPNWNDYSDEEPKALEGKRTWTSDNAIRVWGKRNNQPDDEIIVLPMYDQ